MFFTKNDLKLMICLERFMILKNTISVYNTYVNQYSLLQIWNLYNTAQSITTGRPRSHKVPGLSADIKDRLPQPYFANEKNKQVALDIVKNFTPKGGTNMYDSLKVGIHLGQFSNHLVGNPIVMFLTDGYANVGISKIEKILSMTSFENYDEKKIQLHTLGFGNETKREFLERISLSNAGTMTYIHPAADATNQINDIFNKIATPVAANLSFSFPEGATDVTKSTWLTLNQGQEAVLAGKLPDTGNYNIKDFKTHFTSANGKEELSPVVTQLTNTAQTTNESFSHLEKYHAYMKVTQLIEEAKKQGDATSEEATKLALEVLVTVIKT